MVDLIEYRIKILCAICLVILTAVSLGTFGIYGSVRAIMFLCRRFKWKRKWRDLFSGWPVWFRLFCLNGLVGVRVRGSVDDNACGRCDR